MTSTYSHHCTLFGYDYVIETKHHWHKAYRALDGLRGDQLGKAHRKIDDALAYVTADAEKRRADRKVSIEVSPSAQNGIMSV